MLNNKIQKPVIRLNFCSPLLILDWLIKQVKNVIFINNFIIIKNNKKNFDWFQSATKKKISKIKKNIMLCKFEIKFELKVEFFKR